MGDVGHKFLAHLLVFPLFGDVVEDHQHAAPRPAPVEGGHEQLNRDDTIPQTRELLELLETLPEFLPEFDGEIFADLVDGITVDANNILRFRLKNGLELTETVERSVR